LYFRVVLIHTIHSISTMHNASVGRTCKKSCNEKMYRSVVPPCYLAAGPALRPYRPLVIGLPRGLEVADKVVDRLVLALVGLSAETLGSTRINLERRLGGTSPGGEKEEGRSEAAGELDEE
jgi:hypothetical protein